MRKVMSFFSENLIDNGLGILDYGLGEVLVRCHHVVIVMRIGAQTSNDLQ